MSESEPQTGLARALRESEERFHLFVSSVEDYAIFMLDIDGCIASWNVGAERMKGYSSDEIIGHHFSLFYGPDDAANNVPANELVQAAANECFRTIGWRVRKDGSRFFAQVVITALRDDQGVLYGYAQVTRDISTRRPVEGRFQVVVESMPSAIVMINQNGTIEMVNAQAERIFGYLRTEMIGQPGEMLVPVRFRRGHPAMREQFHSNTQARPMGATRDLFGLRKDGSEFPIELGLNPIDTEDGPMVLSAIVDISTRKHLEERFRLVVESAPNAMVMVNSNGRIEMVNAQAERVFDYARAEMLGQPIEMLVPDSLREHHPTLRQSFFTEPLSRPMGAGRDLYARRKDGSEFPVEIGLNPIETEQGSMVLSAIVDISDRKQKEENIQRALAEKDILLGEIHHRVKNNLQIVHSLLDLQCTQIEDSAVQQMLRDSQNRIRSMAIIHQTLYQSKDFAATDFTTVLSLICNSLLASYGVDGNRIRLVIDAKEVPLAMGKAIPCGLIVNELVTNSLKHAFANGRKGSISIKLRCSENAIELTIEDDGIGIAPSIDLGLTGTLGLQLVNLLTDQIGGALEINRVNPTRFVLKFPL